MWFNLIWLSALKRGTHSHCVPEIKKTQYIIMFYVNLPGAVGLGIINIVMTSKFHQHQLYAIKIFLPGGLEPLAGLIFTYNILK
jgi:hypothetical protein